MRGFSLVPWPKVRACSLGWLIRLLPQTKLEAHELKKRSGKSVTGSGMGRLEDGENLQLPEKVGVIC